MDGINSDSGPAKDAWETIKEESPVFFLYRYSGADFAAGWPGIGVSSVTRDLNLCFH
jgi:hypothetical protein